MNDFKLPTLGAIREWLLAKAPGDFVGTAGSTDSCLIVRAIHEMYHVRVWVSGDGDVRTEDGQLNGGAYKKLVTAFDDLDDDGNGMTDVVADEALDALSTVLGIDDETLEDYYRRHRQAEPPLISEVARAQREAATAGVQ